MNSLLGGSLFIGQYFGINVRVHATFLILAAYRLLTSLSDGGLAIEATFTALIFLLILTHEFGHCFAARSVNGDAREILMWPLGGLAYAHAPMTPWAQFVTVAGGPLVNVIWCVICGIAITAKLGTFDWFTLNPFQLRTLWAPDEWLTYVVIMYNVSYYILLFNLLPIYPMDGGQLFMTMIWPLVGLRNAMLTACRVGVGGAIVLGGLGFMNGNVMLVVLACFGAWTCYQQLQGLKYGTPVDERVATYNAASRFQRPRRGFWARMFGTRSSSKAVEPPRRTVTENPNPGGWNAKIDEEQRLDAEVDRILKKVHDEGIGSLTYVEKQALERARRMRIDREREYQQGGPA